MAGPSTHEVPLGADEPKGPAMTDREARREDLSRMTMKELRALASVEGVCLGYAGSRKDTAVDEIVSSERYLETEGDE
ncbi:MAG: hypothetical protein KH372_08545 [Olsenella uli]|uniref:hypothetical protein n=1 Tax=Olsenella uli TaxID=133926 RepID=UPI001D793965|nr:hypothetical protein [Olsenella uli]MBS6418850.1 hypothetical protein [Olsenella uli]